MMVIWYYRMQSKISIKFQCICLKFSLFHFILLFVIFDDIVDWIYEMRYFWMTSLFLFSVGVLNLPMSSTYFPYQFLWQSDPELIPLALLFNDIVLYIRFWFAAKRKNSKLNDCCIFRCLLPTIEIIDNDIANLQNECYKPKFILIYCCNISSNICPLPYPFPIISIINFCVKCWNDDECVTLIASIRASNTKYRLLSSEHWTHEVNWIEVKCIALQ